MNTLDPATGNRSCESAYAGLPGDISVSFEFFPPKNQPGEAQLSRSFARLAPFAPGFVSMTYGAGGSTRERSLAAVKRLIADGEVPVAAHLTCVGASREEVDAVAIQFHDAGVRHIVALRGDAGEPGEPFSPHPQGYKNATELVAGLRALADFDISVAAYPEVHPDALGAEADLENLKRKLDAGASRALTQFFFSPDTFLRFRDRAVAAGIEAPIAPGILPVSKFGQVRKFAEACGAQVPEWMHPLFAGLDEHPETSKFVSTAVTADLCRSLYEGGVRDFHFYTLNRAEQVEAVCHLMGRRLPAARLEAAA